MLRRVFVVVALTTTACNQVFGLDPIGDGGVAVDGAEDAEDAEAGDDAATCAPVSGTPARPGQESRDQFDVGVNAAAVLGNTAYVVGVRSDNDTDGLIAALDLVAPEPPPWKIIPIGGTLNDQLWTIAAGQNQLLAGGMTRSFRGALMADQGLLVSIDSARAPSAVRVFAPDDAPVQIRAIAATAAGGWWVAGSTDRGAFVSLLDGALATTDTDVRFAIDLESDVVPRRVISNGAAPYVVGVLGTQARSSFIAKVDTGDLLDTSWAVTATFEVFDAAVLDRDLWVVGNLDGDGVMVRLDTTGALLDAWRVPGRPLHKIDRVGATTWLGGATATGAFVAVLDGDCLSGTDLVGLTRAGPITSSLPLVFDGPVPIVAGLMNSAARVIPLGSAAGACGGAPFIASRTRTTLTLAAVTFSPEPGLVLTSEAITSSLTSPNIKPTPLTCP